MAFARFFMLFVLALPPAVGEDARQTQNVVLVTADGLRWQEVFRGIDETLMRAKSTGMDQAQELKEKLWAESPQERRELLMPFFWTTIARDGLVLGNRDLGSTVKVSNGIRVSYPGYSEILTGKAQDDVIDDNDEIQNPSPTVLEVLRGEWRLKRDKVALFASWDVFPYIGESTPQTIVLNAGYQPFKQDEASWLAKQLSEMQFEVLTPWRQVRHDYFTFELAFEYFRKKRPRVLYVALGETDDWAHEGRYDRTLEAAQFFDRCLEKLWRRLQVLPEYRNKTTLLVTTDHGRGSKLEDWTRHGASVEGSEFIWIAAIGPDIPPRGEVRDAPTFFQRDVAPTLLELAGVDHHKLGGVEGKPIPVIVGK